MDYLLYLDRPKAADFLTERGFPTSPRTLGKLASTGGGPTFRKLGSRRCLYTREDLLAWVESRLSPPMASTSSEAEV